MRIVLIATLGVAALCLWSISCSTIDDGDLNDDQRDLQSQIQTAMNDLDREIERTKGEIESATEEARQSLTERLDRLQETRDDLQGNLDKLAETSEDEWNEFESAVKRTLESARLALEETRGEPHG